MCVCSYCVGVLFPSLRGCELPLHPAVWMDERREREREQEGDRWEECVCGKVLLTEQHHSAETFT